MSYILDALNKLEEKRRSEAGQYLPSPNYSSVQNRKGNFPWRHLIVFGLFLNLLIFLWALHPWRSEKALETGMRDVVRKTPAQSHQKMVRDTTSDLPDSSGRKMQPIGKTEESNSAEYKDSVSAAPSEAFLSASDQTSRKTKVITMSELPLSVRQKLPDLSISGHFYGVNPSGRVVTVGGRTFREGAAVAPGVTLERITPDGVVFSCDGLRFYKGVF